MMKRAGALATAGSRAGKARRPRPATRPAPVLESYDVVVVGGGAAGIAAAVGAAQSGARTVLLESAGYLGGAATQKCVQTYCGLYTMHDAPRPAVMGVSAQIVAKLRKLGGVEGPLKFRGTFLLLDTEAVKFACDQVCEEAGVEVILHATMTRAPSAATVM